MGPALLWRRGTGRSIYLRSGQLRRIQAISTIRPIMQAASGLPMLSTHLDFCRTETLISTTWGSITRVCPSTAKGQAENRGRQLAHDCGEAPSTGIITTSSRSNGARSAQATFAPGRFRRNTAIVLTKLLWARGLAFERPYLVVIRIL